MDSASSDGEEEKPSSVRLLVNLVNQQMEASQRREERVIALLEQMSAQVSVLPTAGAAPDATTDPGVSSAQLEPRVQATAAHPSGGDVAGTGPALHSPLPLGTDPGRSPRGTEPSGVEPSGAESRALTGHPSGDRGAAAAGQALRAPTPPAPSGAGYGLFVPAVHGSATGAPAGPQSDPDRSRARSRLPAAATPAPRLISSASLKDFESWRSKFDGFRLLVGLNELPQAEQRAALLALVDDDWARVVRFGLSQPTATIDQIIIGMQQHLRRQRNVIIDRRDFNMRLQQPGETFDEYLCALKETASFCDFCRICIDDRLRDRLVVGVRDEDARRRMLELPELTLQSAADICRASENARSSASAIGGQGTSSLAQLSRYQRDRRSQRSDSQRDRRSQRSDSQDSRGQRDSSTTGRRCGRCGRTHQDGQSCPATGRTCRKCQKTGHFAAVCRNQEDGPRRSRGRSASRHQQSRGSSQHVRSLTQGDRGATPAPTERLPDVRVRGISARCSPRVQLQLHRPDDDAVIATHWTPDTGAETSAVSLKYANKMGIKKEDLSPPRSRLLNADNREMQCFGTCNITLQLGNVRHTVEAAVVQKLNGPLLSWHDSIKLRILPESYPQQLQSVRTTPSPAVSTDAERVTSRARSSSRPEKQEEKTKMEPPKWIPKTVGAASRGIPSLNERHEHFKQMKTAFPKVFDTTSPLREMSGGLMAIELTDDAVPFALRTPRAIPFCWREEVREQLEDMIQKDVIEPVHHPTVWCHPLVPVPKTSEDGSATGCRLTIDFTRLNKFVKRPIHPVRSTHDAVASIGTGAQFFTKLDAKAGYHQVPIREEDQDLTTFITPWGRYRFRRAAMGLVSSGDVYNQRGDEALGDIPRTCKVVDDVIIWDASYDEHLRHVWDVIKRCDDNGITLNPKKCAFAAESINFCGYTIGTSGYTPDAKKTAALSKFPRPECLTDLRSFLGLVHQMGSFSPEVAGAAEPLRQLLRPKNAWLWTEEHTKAFNEVKTALLKPPVLGFFSPARRTVLETDAARLKGLGFCLRQQDEAGTWRLIQCGSRFLTETETRYAVIEVEMLAIVWAIRKCYIYLQGMQKFEVVTDHRPLIPILNEKSLQDISNPRLQRLRESITSYNFTAVWRQGRLHAIPDALSRYPVEEPTEDDETVERQVSSQISNMVIRTVTSVEEDGTRVSPFEDATLSAVRAASQRDPELMALKEATLAGFPDHKSEAEPQIRPYWSVRDRLAVDGDLVLCGQRLIVPSSLRRDVLQKLHASHQGEERTKRRARQVVYWPGIDRDISNTVKSCPECQRYMPKQQKEPIIQMPAPTRVFEVVSADFFEYGGRTYLVYVDRMSGWPWVSHMGRSASAHQLVTSLRQAFASTGVPNLLLSDGGPQFTAKKTRDFLSKWEVNHQLSSPHYPQANGHAESAVKAVKRLIKKTTSGGDLDSDAFAEGLLELRNSPRADGRSAAQVLLGHPLRSRVPAHHSSFAKFWQERAAECDKRAAEQRRREAEHYNASARQHRPLQIGQHVLMQDPRTGLWDSTGTISGLSQQRRSFLVRTPSGRIYWRNRRFLRPLRPLITVGGQPSTSPADAPSPAPEVAVTEPSTPRTVAPAAAAAASPSTSSSVSASASSSPADSTDRESEPRSPPALRRGTRNRQRPSRLQVHWGGAQAYGYE